MLNFMNYSICFALLLLVPSCKQSGDHDLNLRQDSLYKILPNQNYDPTNLEDCITPMPLDVESGFMHASFGNQVQAILQKFFNGSSDVILLELDSKVLQSNGLEIRREQNKPGGDFFPHIYGGLKIPAVAVISVIKVFKTSEGTWGIK